MIMCAAWNCVINHRSKKKNKNELKEPWQKKGFSINFLSFLNHLSVQLIKILITGKKMGR